MTSGPLRGARSGSPPRRGPARVFTLATAAILAGGLLAATLWAQRPAPELGVPEAPVMLAWTSADLQQDLAAGARSAKGIGSVAQALNGLGWLTAWADENGPRESPAAGFMVPIEILAVDPEEYVTFVPEPYRELFQSLADGGSLLSRTGAALRGIENRGSLTLGDHEIAVHGVVPDAVVSAHEAVVSRQTAAILGIDEPRYVLMELRRGTGPHRAAQRLREALPEDARLGTRVPAESGTFRPGGSVLPQAEVKTRFGEFAARPTAGGVLRIDPRWILDNTSVFTIPLLGTARCHNRVIPQIRGAFEEVIGAGLESEVRPDDFGGCFAPRLLNPDPNSGISRHTWGIAFDFNVSENQYGAEPSMDPRLVEVMQRWGFAWGGYWTVPDGMHFEYLTEPL